MAGGEKKSGKRFAEERCLASVTTWVNSEGIVLGEINLPQRTSTVRFLLHAGSEIVTEAHRSREQAGDCQGLGEGNGALLFPRYRAVATQEE